jgi:hypothetical protein
LSDVAVAGSNNDNRFAVIDFSSPTSPTHVLVSAGFLGGCMVDNNGTLAAVGNYNGSDVAFFDISNPAAPVARSVAHTTLAGIGAISFDGTHVLVGEVNGQRAVLINAANPAAPTILSTFTTAISSISSIALKGTVAVASGPNDAHFAVLNYSNPAAPTQTTSTPGGGGVFFGGAITCDLDGSHAAVADYSGGDVYLYDVSSGTPNLLGRHTTGQAGVSSISISGHTVAAASTNDLTISIVDFLNPAAPTSHDNPTGLSGGATVKLSGSSLLGGDANGLDVKLFSVAGTSTTASGTANSGLASIATLGFSSFTPVTPVPAISVTPASLSLAFGPVRVGTASPPMTVTLASSGTAPLQVSGVHTSDTHYVVSPSGNLSPINPGASTTLHVIFTPSAAQSYPGTLIFTTNDPHHPTVTIALFGSGGYPHMVVPGPLDLGSVPVCLTHTQPATVGNTGPVPLHLTGIATTGPGFSDGGSTLVVPPMGSAPIDVTFRPTATGPATGTLSFHSDDPNTPNASVSLSGNGTPEPPPTLSVSPTMVNFGGVPLQYFVGIAITVANTGPCEDLAVTLSVAGAAFLLTTGDPTTLPMTNPPISATIPAGTSSSYTAVFAPTANGPANGTLTVTSNDPAHPSVTIPLTGTGVAVSPAAVELILDRSGSMATPITGGTRMTALQQAVSMFAMLVLPDTGFAMGSVEFDTTEAVLTPLVTFDAGQQSAIVTGANSLSPRNLTSIGGGLQLGQTNLSASPLPRRVAIVFTDGYENTPPMIASVEPGVIAAGTEVYAVGLGDPAYLSTAALANLAASSNGRFFQTTDPLVLRKQFVEVLADAFRQNLAVDPIIDLTAGTAVTIPVNITRCESRISFVLLWEDPTAQVHLTVRAPDGTVISPASASHNRLVRYIQRPGYRVLQITLPPGPHRTIGPNQLGVWEMHIDPVAISGGTTRASTSVLVEGELEMAVRVHSTTVGQPITLQAQITNAGAPVAHASVHVKLTAPMDSLAQLSTPAVRHRAAAADRYHIPPALQILTRTRTQSYEAEFLKRFYEPRLPIPHVDGVYHAEVTATGMACGGSFERYWSGSFYIGLKGARQLG